MARYLLCLNGLAILLNACGFAPRASPLPPPFIYLASPTPAIVVKIVRAAGTPEPASATPAGEPDLIKAGQHISTHGSLTATETEAAGPMLCQIERGSPAFSRLVGMQDPDIIFKQWEGPPYDQDSRLMHPAMSRPLTRLKDRVQLEWSGKIKLMVTAAYDSTRAQHDLGQPDLNRRYSLHFEGRSLDLVPFPPDPEGVARLCALAHQAGFDWVHNEQDHCHVSIQAQSLCGSGN